MVDINKVIYLELRNKHGKKFSNTRLRFIASYLNIDSDWIIGLSEKYDKVWIDKSDTEFSIIYAKHGYSFSVCEAYWDLPESVEAAIKSKTPVFIPPTPPQQKKVKVPKKLDLDTILDKITAKGIASLTESELNFLDELSKQK
jgi:hypothetical protein